MKDLGNINYTYPELSKVMINTYYDFGPNGSRKNDILYVENAAGKFELTGIDCVNNPNVFGIKKPDSV